MQLRDLPIGAYFIFIQDNIQEYPCLKISDEHYKNTSKDGYQYLIKNAQSVLQVEIDSDGKAILPPPYDHVPAEFWASRWKDAIDLPEHWAIYGQRVLYKGSKFSIKEIGGTRSTRTFRVILDEGTIPSARDLGQICDGNMPVPEDQHPAIFGWGMHHVKDNEYIIRIDID